ncbi:hypothetical protein MTO96_045646 [Rhipicephalus appendiculatus]
MSIFHYIFAVSIILSGSTTAAPSHKSPSCDVILQPNYPRTGCYYKCYSPKRGWIKGTHNDGTSCQHTKFPRSPGQCMRGVCIANEVEIPKVNATTIGKLCDGKYRGPTQLPR